MRHIYKEQLNDLNSQSYLLHHSFNQIASSTEFKHLRYPKLKKLQAKDLVAKAMKYDSWTQLNVKVSGNQPQCQAVDLFESRESAREFFMKELDVSKEFSKELVHYILFKGKDQEFDFIYELCEVYDVSLARVYDEDTDYGWTISEEGDMSVGQHHFMSGLHFWNKADLNKFLQRHIKVVRSGYEDFDNIERVFDKLLELYNKECDKNIKRLNDNLTFKTRTVALFNVFALGRFNGNETKNELSRAFIDVVIKEFLYCDELTTKDVISKYGENIDHAIQLHLAI